MNKEEAITFLEKLVDEYANTHVIDSVNHSIERMQTKVNYYIEFKNYIKDNLKEPCNHENKYKNPVTLEGVYTTEICKDCKSMIPGEGRSVL